MLECHSLPATDQREFFHSLLLSSFLAELKAGQKHANEKTNLFAINCIYLLVVHLTSPLTNQTPGPGRMYLKLCTFDRSHHVEKDVFQQARTWSREADEVMSIVSVSTGGLPIGAVLMTQRVADVMAPGDHGSTFAGNPLVCAAASTTFDIISDPAFLESVNAKGERLRAGLREACGDDPNVVVR